ncbi:MAG: hypothetical protein FJ267_12865, partial [Planctomycetes bacterium]|nr:hypothetical protein [Planctomycetota bacterium]
VEEESNDSPVATPVTLEQPFSKLPQSLESRLESLEDLIRQCQFNVSINSKTEIPAELFGLYMSLIENDVSDDIARKLLSRMDHHRASDVIDTPASRSALLTAVIEREIPCVEPIVVRRGQRQIAMVVGPTGVGKTTTLAKLAGKLSLDGNIRVGFITFDTYRVAAVDQLQAYADIMRIPMKVVSNADELVEGLRDFASLDLVLIDTAGRSPMDDSAMNELTQITSVVPVDHSFLVLSLTAGTRSLIHALERFQSVRPTSLVLTKLDEVSGLGTILSITQRTQLPFAYTTDGQEVPTDIEPASSCRLARHIVGGGK